MLLFKATYMLLLEAIYMRHLKGVARVLQCKARVLDGLGVALAATVVGIEDS